MRLKMCNPHHVPGVIGDLRTGAVFYCLPKKGVSSRERGMSDEWKSGSYHVQ